MNYNEDHKAYEKVVWMKIGSQFKFIVNGKDKVSKYYPTFNVALGPTCRTPKDFRTTFTAARTYSRAKTSTHCHPLWTQRTCRQLQRRQKAPKCLATQSDYKYLIAPLSRAWRGLERKEAGRGSVSVSEK
eukprot:TRINITY_DN3754_c0_g1_i10.p1 TRINITY_DN3754_c0_g1~~TRINITY_DN3754_c0_g1_i10.p1  ORF type:complete len:130 (+),score=12.18 TRINITY_DN3754_c0_g1_i10:483-872(+)